MACRMYVYQYYAYSLFIDINFHATTAFLLYNFCAQPNKHILIER